ncbi:DUF1272 domain-containing protein [Motiliproteus sediminis]|uniref:DUF1272 domain-containing protein n=1 Tax=Motiliproteus sediminis TaxID=1468178 RepID=UPI001AEFA055|nr:DUF1272 domain-containing protein [Motiliproteus sediminis]
MLELRPNCECCDRDLPPDSTEAMICSYECTFCVDCVEQVLHNVCPNCGGGLVARPIRPQRCYREEVGLVHHPASGLRVHTPYSREQIAAFVAAISPLNPSER